MTTIVKWSPLRELDSMERLRRRLFDDIRLAPALLPPSDVYETDDEYVVELEVPGFEQEELGIEVTDHQLTVKGERKEIKDQQEKAFRLHERLERQFERRFQLPPEADTEHVQAKFVKGVLEVHTPKLAVSRSKKIEITRG
jgi:HSP20 family protein